MARSVNKNKKFVVLTVICLLLLVTLIGLFVWVKLTTKSDSDTQGKGYIIVVNDTVTAYEGDEQLLTPHIVDANGAVQQGRFSYTVVDAENAPITVDESGIISVKEGSSATSAVIEIIELNTQTKTHVSVTVERKLTGIKGVVFGEDLVVATSTQELTLGDEYTVTVKTIPSHAVLTDNQVTIKTVDKYGKEVQGVLNCAVVPGTNKIKITPTGLGVGTMVFSITADGKELCKDEKYGFSVSMKSPELDAEIVYGLKAVMSDDPVEREKIELIPSGTLSLLTTVEVSAGVETLYGLNKTLFSSLDTVIFSSAQMMSFDDETVEKDVCYRVRSSIFNDYIKDQFWKDYSYSLIPYESNALTETWAVYHYYNDSSTERATYCEKINSNFSLKTFTAYGYSNDYYYIGSTDPKPQSDSEKQSLKVSVLNSAVNAEKNGVHIEVGYTPNTYTVRYVIREEGSSDRTVNDTRTFVYGESYTLYSAENIASALGNDVTKTGYTLYGWLIDPSAPENVLEVSKPQSNLTGSGTATLYSYWKPIVYTVVLKDTDLQNITVEYDSMLTLPTPVKTGYKFLYYTDSAGTQYLSGQYRNLSSVQGTITLNAIYTPISYTVVFNKDGGTWMGNGTDSVVLTYDGDPYTLYELNPPTGKKGYEWIQVDSNNNPVEGRTFSKNDTILNLSTHDGDTVYLRAFWDPIRYTIVYSFPNFTYSYIDKDYKTQTAVGTYSQSRFFGDNASLIEPSRIGYSAFSWTGLYYTEDGSTVQISLNNITYNLKSNEDLIPGASTDENGRTYYLQLYFSANPYNVTFDYDGATSGNSVSNITVIFDQPYGTLPAPKKTGYSFEGWYDGTQLVTASTIMQTAGTVNLKANWKLQILSVSITNTPDNLTDIPKNKSESVTVKVTGGSGSYSYSSTSGSGSGYSWTFTPSTGLLTVKVTKKDLSGTIKITVTDTVYGSTATISKGWSSESCVAEGTLITLADGTQKPVEQLTGDEMLLVWNFLTGTFDVAPILCIDYDVAAMHDVINLYFSDGTTVKVISEHGFWDATLNRYVYLDYDAAQYIGHLFNKQIFVDGVMTYTEVELTDVIITEEYTTTWSPVTYSYLCIYVNGMLSMPGGIDGLFDIFDVNPETMEYDFTAMEEDIQTYGLYTYEELSELIPIPEELFEAVPCAYLKVAVGKGLVTVDGLREMFENYMDLLIVA